MNDDLMGFEIEITDDEVKTLYYAVCEAIKTWPGAPARPLEEQERLFMLRDSLFQMTLEIVWEKEA